MLTLKKLLALVAKEQFATSDDVQVKKQQPDKLLDLMVGRKYRYQVRHF